MNEDNRLPIDPMDDAESPKTRDLLEIERRLKSARPLPFDLDGYELARQAGTTPMRGERELDVSRRRRRRVGTLVAASWICGAMIGALGMFAVMQRHAATNVPVTTAQLERQLVPPRIAPQQSANSPRRSDPSAHGTMDSSELDSWILADAGTPRALSPGRRSVLCVGMATPAFIGKAPEYLASLESSFPEFQRSEADFDGSPARSLDLPTDSDFTRARLMQELLVEPGVPLL